MLPLNTTNQLETLNELFFQFTQSDPELTENAKQAIRFFSKESQCRDSKSSLNLGIERLIELYFGLPNERYIGVEFWPVESEDYLGTLWLRNHIQKRLLRLSGYREGMLLITGLRAVIFRGHHYWTQSCENEFKELKTWIESYVLERVSSDQNLKLLIL